MRDRLNFKFNYSKSFVDAPYLYRINEIGFLLGKGLEPERLHSFQLTASAKKFVKGLETEINFYYNNAIGLLSTGADAAYNWDLAVVGAELVAKYSIGDFSLNANLSLLKVQSYNSLATILEEDGGILSNEDDHLSYRNSVFNVPNFTSNIVAGYKFFDKMRLNVNLYYTGRQYFYASMSYNYDPDVWKIPQVFLVSPSLNFDFKHFTLDISVHNAFNHKYSLGGKCFRPIQQKGAWLMVEAGYRF